MLNPNWAALGIIKFSEVKGNVKTLREARGKRNYIEGKRNYIKYYGITLLADIIETFRPGETEMTYSKYWKKITVSQEICTQRSCPS